MKNYNGETMRTITVAELIELLQDQEPSAKVIFSTSYGDYSRTEQALPIKGEMDTVTIERSVYSNSGFAIAKSEDGDEPVEYEPFLVIR